MGNRQMNLFDAGGSAKGRPRPTDAELKNLTARIHPDFKPVWERLPEDQQLAVRGW
jgi:hypothetical protein